MSIKNKDCIKNKQDLVLDRGPFYHGTKANLELGDLIKVGFKSNYGERKKASFVYMTATLDAAIWVAELSLGDNKERIYIVEPTGEFENDPNLTDKRFPGNPTRSYRTKYSLKIIAEVSKWNGHSKEELDKMKKHLNNLKKQGIEAIND